MNTTVLEDRSISSATNLEQNTLDDIACDSETVDDIPEGLETNTEESRSADDPLADIVDRYPMPVDVPLTDWLITLDLEKPRRSIHCLGPIVRFCKRCTDIVVSLVMLIVLFPLMVAVGLLVKFTSPGGALFRQTRVGLNERQKSDRRRPPARLELAPEGKNRRVVPGDRRNETAYGRPFVLYKFRTMRNDAEKNGAQFATENDPRVTKLGKFLRKSRIDELPQLWNVLKGDMSLVGPRPERPEFIEKLSGEIPDYLQRLGLKPGLTGLAQVVNGYDNDIDGFRRKVAFDLLYLQNCCLRNDLKILVRTAGVVVTGKGAL